MVWRGSVGNYQKEMIKAGQLFVAKLVYVLWRINSKYESNSFIFFSKYLVYLG